MTGTAANLTSSTARAHARPGRSTSHQARHLAHLASDVYVHQGYRVHLLDTYSFHDKRIAIVSEVDDSGIFEVFYDQLELL